MATMIKDRNETPMDAATIERIGAINRRFYDGVAASFAATRERPWPGWERIVAELEPPMIASVVGPNDPAPIGHRPKETLLDVACGNLRFEQYLGKPPFLTLWNVTAVDGSAALIESADMEKLPPTVRVHPLVLDLLDPAARAQIAGLFDAVVCFGFLHHIPGARTRLDFVRWLVDKAAPGGRIALSLWQFERNAALIARIAERQAEAARDTNVPLTEPGDWWLPWQAEPGRWRYCHSFSDEEVASIVSAVSQETNHLATFAGPGDADRYNDYVLLEKAAR